MAEKEVVSPPKSSPQIVEQPKRLRSIAVIRLLNATDKRMFIESFLWREEKIIQDLLIRVSEKLEVSVPDIVGNTEKLLKAMPNLYVNQAINMAMGQDMYGFATKLSEEDYGQDR
jgi:nitrogen-specific signal transduction histidine kinase